MVTGTISAKLLLLFLPAVAPAALMAAGTRAARPAALMAAGTRAARPRPRAVVRCGFFDELMKMADPVRAPRSWRHENRPSQHLSPYCGRRTQ